VFCRRNFRVERDTVKKVMEAQKTPPEVDAAIAAAAKGGMS
jgi:hypothetical protein